MTPFNVLSGTNRTATRNALVVATLISALIAATPLRAAAETSLDRRLDAAHEVLQDLTRIPERGVPSYLLNRAYAVAVIPNVVKAGFVVGGSYGRGVLLVRRSDGRWSNPSFVRLANAGIGWQFGVQGSDLVLVFKNRQGVDNIAQGKFTLGGSASASAGPVGRSTVAATDGEFKAEIYTYARSRGLFAGVSLDGGAITIDHEANAVYYDGTASALASRILNDDGTPTPATARPLLETLTAMAPPLSWDAAPTSRAAQAPAATPDGAKTFAVEDSAKPAPETVF